MFSGDNLMSSVLKLRQALRLEDSKRAESQTEKFAFASGKCGSVVAVAALQQGHFPIAARMRLLFLRWLADYNSRQDNKISGAFGLSDREWSG